MAISNLFIIGAGFTKAVFPSAPVNDDLLAQVVGPQPDNSPLGQVWSEYGLSNIETLLTRFDLDLLTGKSRFGEDHRNAVNKQLAGFVARFRFKQDVPWLHPLTRIISDNDVILSLNYDCFLEGFLDFHKAWSPKGGYHIIENPLCDGSVPDNQRNVRILKIHGSESFRRSAFLNKPGSVTIGLRINEALFPRSGKNIDFGCKPDDGGYVIAPSFTKQFHVELEYLLLDATRFARAARNLVIIGCGLRREDSYLWLVLTSFMHNSRWKKKRTVVIGPHAFDTKKRIEDFWGRKIFDQRNLVAIDLGLESGIARLAEVLRKGVDG
ncbi:MAG: hypothetical protein ACR2FX_01620 [Chthoniobacterales bacterium]